MPNKIDINARKPWIMVSAYDVSLGETSEGYVAFNLLKFLAKTYRIVLITRQNNKKRLTKSDYFSSECPVHVIGYDLPKWASWWKSGARFYQLYAYLWQITWPLIFINHKAIKKRISLIHVLNFHNDNIPSLAWVLGPPVVWGPINHNELIPPWRRKYWPRSASAKHLIANIIRLISWRFDPFLRVQINKAKVIISAGSWVEKRLKLNNKISIIRRSQLGVSSDGLGPYINCSSRIKNEVRLVCAGRLDWIKGLDIAIESLSLLPVEYKLRIVGKGPAKNRLLNLAKALNVDDRIDFEGSVERNRLAEIYADSDIFVFASAEVAGLVWVEALSCGLPVVAFDSPGEVSDAQKYLPGIYLARQSDIRDENLKSFASMIQVAENAKCNHESIRTEVLRKYQWSSLSDVIEKAYSEAMGITK
jgi:glycosyltransferase involved in cell wall biosynthesis